MEDIIDESGSNANQEVPQSVKTLGIISIIGSSLWGLIMLIALFYVMVASASLGRFLPIADPGGMMAAIIIVFLLLIALNVFGIVGASKMMKGKKSGFILYAIVTGLWALLMLLSGANGAWLAIVSGLASVGFIVGFGMQMKNMPESK
ncbi:MAG: hypothetical protein WDZ35_11065 [Crocinitomicaceae bacterium]